MEALRVELSLFKNEVPDRFSKLENRILESEDKILKELQDMRDDMAITSGYSDRLEDHEDRIETLEKQVLIQ